MTGTPLDLTPFRPMLSAIGWLFWLIVLALVVAAWWLPKLLWQKIASVAIVVACFLVFVARPMQVRMATQQAQRQESNANLEESMALFKKRCEGAGEKITRTVDNVDGVVWMKWRDKEANFSDQFKLDDPYGRDCGGEDCIARLLRVTFGAELNPEEANRYRSGYRFVESIDPKDGQRYRYTGQLNQGWNQEAIDRHRQTTGSPPPPYSYRFKIERVAVEKFNARYGIAWDDISTREDREHWIAGSSLKVIDLQTNEVIAERTGYLIDRGQGSTAGFRTPWTWARSYGPSCPSISEGSTSVVFKSVKPSTQGG